MLSATLPVPVFLQVHDLCVCVVDVVGVGGLAVCSRMPLALMKP